MCIRDRIATGTDVKALECLLFMRDVKSRGYFEQMKGRGTRTIDHSQLPSAEEVNGWTSEQYVSALTHDQSNPGYNANVRQLLHVGFKIAAQMGDRYLDALKANDAVISKCVTNNLLDRHMKPLFA